MADQAKIEADQEFKNGRYQQAIALYTTALEQNAVNGTNPKHTLLSNRSAAYCSLKQYDKALEDALACISCDPGFAKGYSRKGAALVGKGDLEGAVQAYKKVLSLDSTNEAAKQELSRVEQDIKRRQSSNAFQEESRRSQATSQPPAGGARKWVDIILIVAQIFSIVNAVTVVFITDHYESRNAFGRSILSSLCCFVGEAVLRHGLPSFGTFKTLWRAFRGTAAQAEVRNIANFAMDNNTHNIFYCTLTMSAAPSLLLLVPLFLENTVSICRRIKALAPSVAPLKTFLMSTSDRVLVREMDIRKMISNAEVLIFFALILELFTQKRNILLLILYGQLLRVRYIVHPDSRAAWISVAQRADSVLLHPKSPSVVQSIYNKIKSLAAGLVNQAAHAA